MAALLSAPQGLSLPVLSGLFFDVIKPSRSPVGSQVCLITFIRTRGAAACFGVGRSLAVFKELIALCI